MSDDEIMVFAVCVIAGLAGAFYTRTSSLPFVYTKNNPGIGLLRLSVLAVVCWTAYVIQYHGDPSIQGIYVAFYLIMAYAVAKVFGQMGTSLYGLHLRSTVYERKNFAAALFIAGYTIATGIIFGGSVWGEADPLSDAEGGWWIPFGFFILGWINFNIVTRIYLWREPGNFSSQICQERDTAVAWSATVFMVSTSTIILKGVAGDFWGWQHGILGMGTIAIMLVGHEVIGMIGDSAYNKTSLRIIERFVYIGLAAFVWFLNQIIDQAYVAGN